MVHWSMVVLKEVLKEVKEQGRTFLYANKL